MNLKEEFLEIIRQESTQRTQGGSEGKTDDRVSPIHETYKNHQIRGIRASGNHSGDVAKQETPTPDDDTEKTLQTYVDERFSKLRSEAMVRETRHGESKFEGKVHL